MSNQKKRTKRDIFIQKMEGEIQRYLGSQGFDPISSKNLSIALEIPKSQEDLFKEALERLVEHEIVREEKKGYRIARKKADVVTGSLRVHPRGFGFLQPDDPSEYPQDIFIPKSQTHSAVDGDRVEVLVNQHSVSVRGPEGKVLNILSRARSHLAGTIVDVFGNGTASAYAPLLGVDQTVQVEPLDFKLIRGDRIVMEVIDWGDDAGETRCVACHRIGHINDPSCDIKAAIEEFELRDEFPQKAIREAREFGTEVTKEDHEGREDLRKLETFTIDPDTAKDFDDALSLSRDKKGNYHLAVHIADVSHYVRPGSALDEEARERCNSTYFPGTCIPMLPGELSENLCSLKPHVDRLAVSVLASFDPDGKQISHKIVRSVIHSDMRYTYKEARAILDGKKKSKHRETMELMTEFCNLLKKQRYERGSIEFAIPELVVLVDENGMPEGTDFVEYDITHQLVEEFMLKANEIVATHLTEAKKSLAYRVHEEPSDENLKDFTSICAAFGYQLSEIPKPRELQELFDEVHDKPYGEFLATSYIRRMRMAAYSADNIGHYGLMLTHYTHFTSPIRRYIDLTVHRVLFGEGDDRETLASVTELCSEQERISQRAENNVRQLKKLRLLDAIEKESPGREYEAIVTKVKPFGILFEIIDFMLEGFLHVSQLSGDYYQYDEEEMTLTGDYSGGSFQAGDRIAVKLREVDFIMQETSWHLLGEERPARHPRKKSPKKKKQDHRGKGKKGSRGKSHTSSKPSGKKKTKKRKR